MCSMMRIIALIILMPTSCRGFVVPKQKTRAVVFSNPTDDLEPKPASSRMAQEEDQYDSAEEEIEAIGGDVSFLEEAPTIVISDDKDFWDGSVDEEAHMDFE